MRSVRQLSPKRNTTTQSSVDALVREQLQYFSIAPDSEYGKALAQLAKNLYQSNIAVHDLWKITLESLDTLERSDRVAWFNAKRFASFQLAKVLDNLQNPLRRSYQSLAGTDPHATLARGVYPIFDNIPAIFSSTPVITRTATYLYACIEWGEDAFRGEDHLNPIYSRLFNPTSISLANYIVDLEAGPNAEEYLAWNFNSGMAAIDALFSNLLHANDIVLSSRNVYGGTHQLLSDWFGKKDKLNVAIEWFNGFQVQDFNSALKDVQLRHHERLQQGARILVYLESPCNPHGYVLDVGAICESAHKHGIIVACDNTIATPALQSLLRDPNPKARPEFIIHSYTKDIAGSGATTAGCVIGPSALMSATKGKNNLWRDANGKVHEIPWNDTLFWNVFYIKGGFLDADKAFEVLRGIPTLHMRVWEKAINTLTFVRCLQNHPCINVRSPAVDDDPNHEIMRRTLYLGLPAPLLTIDFDTSNGKSAVSSETFRRFFDMLEPEFGLQVSLGQTNSVVLCPAISSHSELSDDELREAGIAPTTIRISIGLEDPRLLVNHIINAAKLSIAHELPDFLEGFPKSDDIDKIYKETYLEVHQKLIAARKPSASLTA
ncbi:MAG: aminotransferase class I/II-fold pyridoxal phosphate-dependent enzyme [Alphaproteobacteria bacterium]